MLIALLFGNTHGEGCSQTRLKNNNNNDFQDTDLQISHMTGRSDTVVIQGTKQRLKLKPG